MARRFTPDYREPVTLRDGSPAVLRLFRRDDAPLLRAGFERLSQASRYARFLAPKSRLTDDELDHLLAADGEHHLAIGALREGEPVERAGLGIARFVRIADTRTADAAITVVDDAQRLGLGRALFVRLSEAASERDIDVLHCDVLAVNTGMRRMLEATGAEMQVRHESGVLTYSVCVQ
jgi:GNAT superfamily N-acetyltransferase